jgi:hypothetical protein
MLAPRKVGLVRHQFNSIAGFRLPALGCEVLFGHNRLQEDCIGAGAFDVCEDIELTVTATHSGPDADVIVQVYMQFLNASVPVPRLTLVQFDKLYNMTDGESRSVSLSVQPERRMVITNETYLR